MFVSFPFFSFFSPFFFFLLFFFLCPPPHSLCPNSSHLESTDHCTVQVPQPPCCISEPWAAGPLQLQPSHQDDHKAGHTRTPLVSPAPASMPGSHWCKPTRTLQTYTTLASDGLPAHPPHHLLSAEHSRTSQLKFASEPATLPGCALETPSPCLHVSATLPGNLLGKVLWNTPAHTSLRTISLAGAPHSLSTLVHPGLDPIQLQLSSQGIFCSES